MNNKLKTKVGTAYYVSPEILKGNYTEKCDIWSAGVILYILLSGDPPFNGRDDQAIYQKIYNMSFSFPEKKWKNISEEAKDLIKHMICPENERYSAEDVLRHPWFKNASSKPLSDFEFDPQYFNAYINSSLLKKMSLLFIASRLDDNDIMELKEIFCAFDKSKDGQISFTELEEGLSQLKSHHLKDIGELFKSLDVDKNGKIDYSEFLAATISKKDYLKEEKLFETFYMLDKDKDRKITKDEIMEVLRAEKAQEEEIEEFIKEADINGDGNINYQEFLKLMGYSDEYRR